MSDKTAVQIDLLSYSSFYVTCFFNESPLSSATCFFVKRHGMDYLITNWHVVTGRNSQTNEVLDKRYASIPNKLRVQVFKDQEIVEREEFYVPLYDIDGMPLWFEHPVLGQYVDVVALPVSIPKGMIVAYVEDAIEPFNEDTAVHISDDLYIIGFPFGLSAGIYFPIWKRASVASEPILDVENLPMIYVDTASRQGMSGSPVIYKEKRAFSIIGGGRLSRYYMRLVGVYSGRVGVKDDFSIQLGRVWKAQVIDDIIMAKVRGKK